MIYSVSNIAWLPNEREESYSILKKNNLSDIEIAPGLLFHSSTDPYNPTEAEIKRVLAELKQYELSIISMQSLLYNISDAFLFGNKFEQKTFKNSIENAIVLASKLNIPNLVFGSPQNRVIPKKMKYFDALDLAQNTFFHLGRLASKNGTCIAIEPNPKIYGTNFINSYKEAVSFVQSINSPGISTVLDLGAILINKEHEQHNYHTNLRKSIKILNHVHVSEPNLEPAPKNIQNFKLTLSILKDMKYSKGISIEMKRKEDSKSNLKKCVEKMMRIIKKTDGK
jgi:sugar phosphate isomerase/epimerase